MRLERIVAVVDKDVITEGELLAEARLALVQREGARAAAVALPDDFVEAFTDHFIGQLLIAKEARRMGREEATHEDVAAKEAALASRFPNAAAYRTFVDSLGMDPGFVGQVLGREILTERYVAQRLRTRLIDAPRGEGDAQARALGRWVSELQQAADLWRLDATGKLRHVRGRH